MPETKGPTVQKSTPITGLAILAIISVLFGTSYLVTALLRLPPALDLPVELKLVGVVVIAAGFLVARWIFKHRPPSKMIVSTYVTFTKILGRARVDEIAGRTEPLVVDGPQKYTRNPLYFTVVLTILGLGLLTAATYILVASIVFLLMFSLLLIPFEERELEALFGDQWRRYSETTPMLIPFTKRKKQRPALTGRETESGL